MDNKKLWIKDNGVGIDDERIEIIRKYGASTKDKRDDLIGCFGIGFYAPLSYTNQFTVESNREGVKRTWVVSKNGTKNEIILLSENTTEEENGTTIIIPIKNDYYDWDKCIKETLLYFKGVIVENIDFNYFNQQKIYEGKYFIYREGSKIDHLHIVLDQVVYTFDWEDFDLYHVNFYERSFIGFKFSLNDGLIPTPSRESIIITDSTKEIVRNRIKEALEELKSFMVLSHDNLFSFFNRNDSLIKVNLGETHFYLYDGIRRLYEKLDVTLPEEKFVPSNEDFNLIPVVKKSFLLRFFKEVGRIDFGNKFSRKYENIHNLPYHILEQGIIVDDEFGKNKIEFFKSLGSKAVFIKFDLNKIRLKDYLHHTGLFLNKKDFNETLVVSKDKWRRAIVAWQEEVIRIANSMSKTSDYRKEYEEWLDKRPKKKMTSSLAQKSRDQITIKFPKIFEVNNSEFNMKFEPSFISVSNLKDKLYIYSVERSEVNELYDLWLNQQNIIPIMVNKSEISKIENLPNCISYTEFAKGKTRFAQKWVTAWLISQDVKRYPYLFYFIYKRYPSYAESHENIYVKDVASIKRGNRISKGLLRHEIDTIVGYMNKWLKSDEDSTFVTSVAETYVKLGLVDKPILDQWEKLKKKLSYYDFLPYIHSTHYTKIDSIVLLKKKNEFYQRQIEALQQELNNCKSK